MANKNFSGAFPIFPGINRFHTEKFWVVAPFDGELAGYCDILFTTPEGEDDYSTVLSPEGATNMIGHLYSALRLMPKPPKTLAYALGGSVPGNIAVTPTTKMFFGQNYETEVLEALGVLTIRANIVDHSLCKLIAAVTGMAEKQAEAQYYSTANMKARLDMVRALVDTAGCKDIIKLAISDALKRLNAAALRRNAIVHGQWIFRKGKHRLIVQKPNSRSKPSELTITGKLILDIAEAYNVAIALLEAHTLKLGETNSAA